MEPILAALRELDVIRVLSPDDALTNGGDALGLHWKLTLNHYRARSGCDDGAPAEAGGALFPWHRDLDAPRARDARVRAARRPRRRRDADGRDRHARLARAALGPRALGVGAPRAAAPGR